MEVVTFEISQKLKVKGFNEPCYMYYHIHDNIEDSIASLECTGGESDFINSYNRYRCAAPTISQVLKWLREQHSIHVSTKPYPCEDGAMWLYEIRKFNKYISIVAANKTGFTREEHAALAGIEDALENLI